MNFSAIVITRSEGPDKPFVFRSIPLNVEKILIYGGLGSDGRCKTLGARRTHKPILVFIDEDVEFQTEIIQDQIDKVRKHDNLIVTLGWRTWEEPTVLITRKETVDKVEFDTNLYVLASLDFLLRAHQKGFKICAPTSPYDGEFLRKSEEMKSAWFWYQFGQTAFMFKHRCILLNAFNPNHKEMVIKPHKFFLNPTTAKGTPTLYKSRRLLCRWIGVPYFGLKRLVR